MVRVAQLGIVVGLIGVVVTIIALFPTLIGLSLTPGIGVIQILVLLVGLILLILGALLYVRFTFYAHQTLTLWQQIGVRLAFTGITFAAMAALADVLGFGSNLRAEGGEVLLGPVQLVGILLSFGGASLGVIIFAVAGDPTLTEE
jgi:hypothetical protein